MQFLTTSEKQTFVLGKKFAQGLKGGEVVGLIGNLGAGKTVFVKGLASGLGIKNKIASPTFVLMKIYPVKCALRPALRAGFSEARPVKQPNKIKQLIHIDAYRLKNGKEILSTGAEEYFNKPNSVVIIEWADRIKEILPKKTKLVKITSREENKRKITIN